MIGKIIGAVIGDQIGKQTRGLSGPAGAAIGFLAPALLRRVSLPAMAAIAAGGYVAKRMAEKQGRTGSFGSSRSY